MMANQTPTSHKVALNVLEEHCSVSLMAQTRFLPSVHQSLSNVSHHLQLLFPYTLAFFRKVFKSKSEAAITSSYSLWLFISISPVYRNLTSFSKTQAPTASRLRSLLCPKCGAGEVENTLERMGLRAAKTQLWAGTQTPEESKRF